MTHRLFVAIKISQPLQHQIFEWQKQFSNLKVRWLPPDNWYIRLIPPWPTEKVRDVINRLARFISPIGRFKMTFNSVSFGPTSRHPHLIWATVSPTTRRCS